VAARVEFDLSAATVAAHIDDGKRIDLCYFLPGLTARDAELAQGAAFVATESLLGEEMLDRWIDTIDVAATRKFSPGEGRPLPLDRMQPTVTALIGSLQEQLPSEPTSRLVDGVEWSGFEMHPEEADADYAARNDLYVAVSGRPDVFTAAHRGSVFDSQCYSRFDETFCYLKIDAESGLEGCQYQGRDELEEALNRESRLLLWRRHGAGVFVHRPRTHGRSPRSGTYPRYPPARADPAPHLAAILRRYARPRVDRHLSRFPSAADEQR